MFKPLIALFLVAAPGVAPAAAATYTFKARNCQRADTRDIVISELTATMAPATCAAPKIIAAGAPVKASAVNIKVNGGQACRVEKVMAKASTGRTWTWSARKPSAGNADFYVDCLLGRIVRHFPAPPAKIDPKNPED
jgi:hypothetical protein